MNHSCQDEYLKQFSRIRIAFGVFQIIIGIGAVGGGLVLVMDPSGGTMGIPISFLAGSPFPNYFIPGLFLLIVNGFGTLAGSVSTLKKFRYAGELAMLLGLILMAWIVIQVLIIKSFSFFHPLYFFAGFVEACGGYILKRQINTNPAT